MYYYSLLRGYYFIGNKFIAPTPFFLKRIGCSEDLDRIILLSKNSIDPELLRLGLECSIDYYADISAEYIKYSMYALEEKKITKVYKK